MSSVDWFNIILAFLMVGAFVAFGLQLWVVYMTCGRNRKIRGDVSSSQIQAVAVDKFVSTVGTPPIVNIQHYVVLAHKGVQTPVLSQWLYQRTNIGDTVEAFYITNHKCGDRVVLTYRNKKTPLKTTSKQRNFENS